jgi:hypothetical protein
MALEVARALRDKLVGSIESVGAAAKSASEEMRRLASNDNLGALTSSVTKAAEGFAALVPGWDLMAASVRSAVGVVTAFRDTVEGFVARGRQLAGLSGPLAGAGARAEVREFMADVREAEELGPGMARLTDVQSELAADLREMLLPIKKFVIEVLADFLEWLRGAVTEIRVAAEVSRFILEQLPNMILVATRGQEGMQSNLNLIRQYTEHIRRLLEKGGEDKDAEFMDEQLRLMLLKKFGPELAPGFDPVGRPGGFAGLYAPLFPNLGGF